MAVNEDLERGRTAYADHAWTTTLVALGRVDEFGVLEPEDLHRLATAAYMLGRDEDHVRYLSRAYETYLEQDDPHAAVRSAFWIGLNLALRGRTGHATGWFRRAARLIDGTSGACVERGYLLVPTLLQQLDTGDLEAARATAAEAVEISQRFGDRDLFAIAVHEEGHALLEMERVDEGLALLDEAMLAVTGGELSPIVTGLVYCSVIGYCQEFHLLQRSQEWTQALSTWCERQPDLVAFTGVCHIHRAEILQLSGAWADAVDEARRAEESLERARNHPAAGQARYQEAEVRRLQGDVAAAEAAYLEASSLGWQPQPGLALLQLARGDHEAALTAIRRCVTEAEGDRRRIRFLAAYVEIALAGGEVDEADRACAQLEEAAGRYAVTALASTARHARGAVELARGHPGAALVPLRHAAQAWLELGAPYDAARARVLIAEACRQLGDAGTAALEADAARQVFMQLGAGPDLASLDTGRRPCDDSILSPRELQVLRLVASGRTNRAIADHLVVSERTVERHVSNIFVKIGVSSRSAATAYAYDHALV